MICISNFFGFMPNKVFWGSISALCSLPSIVTQVTIAKNFKPPDRLHYQPLSPSESFFQLYDPRTCPLAHSPFPITKGPATQPPAPGLHNPTHLRTSIHCSLCFRSILLRWSLSMPLYHSTVPKGTRTPITPNRGPSPHVVCSFTFSRQPPDDYFRHVPSFFLCPLSCSCMTNTPILQILPLGSWNLGIMD